MIAFSISGFVPPLRPILQKKPDENFCLHPALILGPSQIFGHFLILFDIVIQKLKLIDDFFHVKHFDIRIDGKFSFYHNCSVINSVCEITFMSLDHYISQVHLKNFYSPKLGSLMYAIRKSDQKLFTPNAKSVCRIKKGNTNSFLREDRIVEEYLKNIEPKYNAALVKLIEDTIDPECIFVIAGFVAYVSTCSPAAIRINSEPLKVYVEETAKFLNSKNSLRPPPIELGGASLYEFLEKKKIGIKINPEFQQAIGIQLILSMTKHYGNFTWDILLNPFTDNPFFTSDFPIAIERSENPNILNRIIPLSPYLSIRIRPNRSTAREYQDYTFSNFKRNQSEYLIILRFLRLIG